MAEHEQPPAGNPLLDILHARLQVLEGQNNNGHRLKPKNPDTYRGDTKEDVEAWLFLLNLYYDSCGVRDDVQKMQYCVQLFRGDAATWWRGQCNGPEIATVETWLDFQNMVKRQFMVINSSETARDEFYAMSQRNSESIQAFVARLTRVTMLLPTLSDEEKKEKFVRSLTDRKIQTELFLENTKNPALTFETAAQLAERLEACYRRLPTRSGFNDRRPYNYNRAPNGNFQRQNYSRPTPMEIGNVTRAQPYNRAQRMSQDERQKRMDSGNCFVCDQPGHLAYECPQKKREQRSPPNRRYQSGNGQSR